MISPRRLATSTLSIFKYKSIPTVSIKPACSLPKISPAPRIDKSLVAIENPLPNSVKSFITLSLLTAVSVKDLKGAYIKYAYANLLLLPTRPRI